MDDIPVLVSIELSADAVTVGVVHLLVLQLIWIFTFRSVF
jgi:hypothetical protein